MLYILSICIQILERRKKMGERGLVINTKDPSEYSERSFCFLNHMKNKYDFPHFLLLAATVISQLIVIIATAA